MYSKTIPSKAVQQNLLMFQPDSGSQKQAFLDSAAGGNLDAIQFPDRPALHALIRDLAQMFRHRYITRTPTDEERADSERLRLKAETSNDIDIRQAYERHACTVYMDAMNKLQDHTATIALFETALDDSSWPTADPAKKQDIKSQPPCEYILKTGWNTSAFVPLYGN
jgi:hypothetical protein